MEIERELERVQFQNVWHKLRINLLFTSSWLGNEMKNFLAPFKITPKQFTVLQVIHEAHPEPMAIQDIRARMIDPMSDVSRIVERLCQKELLLKQACPQDKRTQEVSLSEVGTTLMAKIEAESARLDAIAHGISEAQAQWLNLLLDELRSGNPKSMLKS